MPVGYDVPPYLVTVGVHLPIFIPPSLMVAVLRALGDIRVSKVNVNLMVTLLPG